MREAVLYSKLSDNAVQCGVCQWRCRINPNKFGVCGMYTNREGAEYNLNYAMVSAINIDPIEKKPLYHFHPGTLVYSLGTLGCNFHCRHCQNWEISDVTSQALNTCHEIQPDAAIEAARSVAQGVAWTYNEPAVWFEYTLDSAKLAKEHNLYTVYVTNGYSTAEALDEIGPYLDAWRVDVKGFSDELYRDLAKVPKWREILSIAERARHKWNMHVEVVTNIIPTLNDDDGQLNGIARWIHDSLGELTPWHVTRFHPSHQLMEVGATPLSTLERACDIGRRAGLKFVYVGNVPGHKSDNTVCYNCGRTAVERQGYSTKIVGLAGSKCSNCGAELNFRTSPGR